ncbi:MAG TPA: hypothetical protein VGD91_25445 [Trebonia sp.]
MSATEACACRTLIVGDPFVLRPCRLKDRMLARVFGASLDRQLAAGRLPESTPLLAARAQSIVAVSSRRAVARNWEHLLEVARRARTARPAAAPLRSDQIVAAEPAIRLLLERLAAPLPVTAQGAALARIPLNDATGPVYSQRSPVTLAELLDTATAHLDPSLPLTP